MATSITSSISNTKKHNRTGFYLRHLSWIVVLLLLSTSLYGADIPSPPSRSIKYKSFFIRTAHYEFGLDAPVALLAGQVHQESAWRPDVDSPYASGLTQFTPSTAKWISEIYPDLGPNEVYNPKWSIRAMMRYDKHLFERLTFAKDSCNQWAMTLSAYNGGYGWIKRDRKLAVADGKDGTVWWDNIEMHSGRAEWAYEENRGYPRRIIYRHQEIYVEHNWGGPVVCPKVVESVKLMTIEEIDEISVVPAIVEVTIHPRVEIKLTWWDKLKEWWKS